MNPWDTDKEKKQRNKTIEKNIWTHETLKMERNCETNLSTKQVN